MENGLLEANLTEADGSGFPELTALGKRIEMLRIERGLSKQALARHAATSRQQLWRVMTGKSELTSTLGQRLADVLQIDARLLRGADGSGEVGRTWTATDPGMLTVRREPATVASHSFAEFVADPAHLERALGTLPSDAEGIRLRGLLVSAVRDVAAAAGLELGPAWLGATAEARA